MERDCIFLLLVASLILNTHSVVEAIGVNYGLLGDNLPPPSQVVSLLKSRNINKIRIFEPNQEILQALHDSLIAVIVGVRNEDLQQLAADPSYAIQWVQTNLVPHASSVAFTSVSAGNEVIPGPLASFVLPAMRNLDSAIKNANICTSVTTVVPMNVLASSYPPSSGAFSPDVLEIMSSIASFLSETQSPLLVNIYPYFVYASDPVNVKLEYALFEANLGVQDGDMLYESLFEAMVDAMYAALEKVGFGDVHMAVSESGWPSDGNGDFATKEKASAYVNNLVSYVASGKSTPRAAGRGLEAYVFAMFNEDNKPAGVEQNFGLYYPDMSEVYHVNF